MDHTDLLSDAFGRIRELVAKATADMGEEGLAYRPDRDANSIAWLVWHLTRVQDDHLADIIGRDQVWTEDGWFDRFGLPFPPAQTGYGHTSTEVAAVRPTDPADLMGYHEAVHARTTEYLRGTDLSELNRIIDDSYDPPVSVGVRLVSVISDNLQHAGQARYVRGMVDRL